MQIKPSLTPYKNDDIAWWSVLDGRVTYFGEYDDPIRLVEALGGSVQPARPRTLPAQPRRRSMGDT